jgi:hypothetical protein
MTKNDDLNMLAQDAEAHPNRGKINGHFVINEGSEKIEITISRETYKRLVLNAASEGEANSTAAARLLKLGLSNPDERGKIKDFLEIKAALFGVTVGEVVTKILGQNKHKARSRKLSRSSKGQETEA